ncbi:FecCD family ABC transporter permease [Nocardiopsis potens]|uniref:FecCD family ABC transporter permease n=1 Tax=Nocardiopsis potens TaxID=1246458 RepID=UPI000345B82B|nr:iron chelate uptake ABC transporter family permease subunit [Nocardiopsis potens]
MTAAAPGAPASGAPARPPDGPGGTGRRPAVPLPVLFAGLALLLAGSAVVAVGVGPVGIGPGTVLRILADRLSGAGPAGPGAGYADYIVWELRAPRVVQGVSVGAGLAVAGVVVQAVVRNPVADPHVLGLSSGAAAGAVAVTTTAGSALLGAVTLPAAAFAGALAAGIGVHAVSRTAGTLSRTRLILAGIAVGQLLGGTTSFLVLRAESADAQQQVLFWLLGSLAGARWDLALTCAAAVTALTAAVLAAGRLNLLVLGDEAASALGLDPGRARAAAFTAAALLTGTVVAVSGTIGFVGLVVPHLARLLVGAEHRRAVPVAALLGALLLVWADTAARTALAPAELPIGILTAAVGVPFFVAALRRSNLVGGDAP